jgi:hypothetical protein
VDGIETGKPVPLADGKARFTTSFGADGEHVMTATYAGDKTYDASASRPLKLRVIN